MAFKEFESAYFHGTDDQERYVTEWRERYDDLLGQLSMLGTEVSVNRILERDKDIPPYRFVRQATHQFIFPPQDVILTQDGSKIIESDPDYSLDRESRTYNFDPEAVRGHVRLFYEDSDSRIQFSADFVDDRTDLPGEVTRLLDRAFLVPVGMKSVSR